MPSVSNPKQGSASASVLPSMAQCLREAAGVYASWRAESAAGLVTSEDAA